MKKVFTLIHLVIISFVIISIYLSILLNLNWLYTLILSISTGLIIIILINIENNINNGLIILTSLIIGLSIRYYPYLLSIPLGVDPIRDVIFEYKVSMLSHIPWNIPRFVDYYKYYPSTQIFPLINSLVTGTDIGYNHYIILSTLFSLGILPIILITRIFSRDDYKAVYIAALLYALIPSISTWGYWVIPMMFSILQGIYSIYLIIIYLERKSGGLISLVLSLFLGITAIMTHAVVGAILIPFYLIIFILYLRSRRYVKSIGLYNLSIILYTLVYWWEIGFYKRYLNNYIRSLTIQVKNLLPKVPKYVSKPYTRSIIIPNIKPQPHYPSIIDIYPDIHPDYYMLPRWIWATLLISIPLILLVYVKIRGKSLNKVLYASLLYGFILSILTVSSLYLHLLWKADRYILSPATIFIIISSAPILIELVKRPRLGHLNTSKIFLSIIIILILIGSLYDPRVSFYTNPIEGDRVTFKYSENIAGIYLIDHYINYKIITDYNLMTSYINYLAIANNKNDVINGIWYGSAIPLLKRVSHSGKWIFLLRKYSIESQYIWDINYKQDPKFLLKLFAEDNLVYSNKENYILCGK